MNRTHRSYLAFVAAFVAAPFFSPLRGQTVPAAPEAKEQETIKLDPFSVSADADVGFVAASSLAGGRIASALKDTPVAYSVITKEFIDAFNVQDIIEAAQWSTNANQVEADGGTRMYGYSATTFVRQRGIKMGLPSQNYFTTSGTADAYNIDRVDMARGPNSAVFGAGGVGGTMNSMTKQAEPSRPITEFQMRLGSFDSYRFTLDVNRPINERFAIRVNAMWSDQGSWRDNFFQTKSGATIALKYVVTPKFNIRAEVQKDVQWDGTISASMVDQISAWDGRTTISTYGLSNGVVAMTAAQLAAAGLTTVNKQQFVESVDWGHAYLNFENRYKTKGAQHNANANNTNRINGVPIRTVGFSLQNAAWADSFDGVPEQRWISALAGSPWMRLPRSEDTWLWTNRSAPGAAARRQSASLFLTYTPLDNLFVEVAGNINESKQYGENTQRRGMLDTKIEINRDLPDGSPNPGFLKPYTDLFVYRTHKNYTLSQVRLQTVYSKTFSRLGTFRVSALGGYNRNEQEATAYSLLLPLTSLAPDARTWTNAAMGNRDAVYAGWTRWYLTDGSSRNWYDNAEVPRTVHNPKNGVREVIRPRYVIDLKKADNNYLSAQESKFIQGSGNFDLFKNHLILTGAFRRDMTDLEIQRTLLPGAAPAGWSGYETYFAPQAPADYYELKFFPKDATGKIIGPEEFAVTRPRAAEVSGAGFGGNRAEIGLPQYANDRFQDDYSAPATGRGVNTWTYGAVANLWKGVGIFANKSTTWNFSPPAQRVDGSVIPPTSANGTDYGIRFTLPNNRLYVTITRFDSYQDGATDRQGTGTNEISTSPVIGDLNNSGTNKRGFRLVSTDTYTTHSEATEGYEFELTANFTRNLRVVANLGYTNAVQRDFALDIIDFYGKNDAIMRQVLADSGVTIGADNLAFISPQYDNPTLINQAEVQKAVDAWNNIQSTVLPGLLAQGPLPQGGNSKWNTNVAMDYRIQSGPLQGLRIGTGLNYRAGQVIGNKSTWTIRDPNNPNVAIDDPAYDETSTLYAPSSLKMVGSLSYIVRLKESGRRVVPKTIQFDLNIDNLTNNRNVVYGNINDIVQTSNTYFRPRVGEDISSPAHRTVPGAFNYIPPRSYTFSAKLNF